MKKITKKILQAAGLIVLIGGVLGSAGALEVGNIGIGQALLQMLICGAVGAGLMVWGCRM